MAALEEQTGVVEKVWRAPEYLCLSNYGVVSPCVASPCFCVTQFSTCPQACHTHLSALCAVLLPALVRGVPACRKRWLNVCPMTTQQAVSPLHLPAAPLQAGREVASLREEVAALTARATAAEHEASKAAATAKEEASGELGALKQTLVAEMEAVGGDTCWGPCYVLGVLHHGAQHWCAARGPRRMCTQRTHTHCVLSWSGPVSAVRRCANHRGR